MTHASERLKAARIAAGYASASEFAKAHDFPEVTYRAHESGGRNFRAASAKAYAQHLGCRWQYLLFGGQSAELLDHQALATHQDRLPPLVRAQEDFAYVPAFDLAASAGHGRLVLEEEPSKFLAFRDDFIDSLGAVSRSQLAVLHVSGDSMEPTLHNGDSILVDRGINRPMDDGVYVVRYDDSLLVKRISIDPFRRKLTVSSDNPLYPPLTDLRPEEVTVIGRVRWVGRRL